MCGNAKLETPATFAHEIIHFIHLHSNRSDPDEFSSKVHELEEEKERQAELMRKQIEEEKMKRKEERTVSSSF